ncbi:hypothetical protein J5226_21655 [Lysobacter sp. K5869]|uniref:hypothetical protein n=1 Tax=Lysobacter sp. K5869 TaxID=2820808 RepID=UPI001C063507|nr:hypothetical protein [Lysobacter sp. K5869]QWP76164.1 hypothetical protein J5226_21655 [Lysobacter sp. K5869]
MTVLLKKAAIRAARTPCARTRKRAARRHTQDNARVRGARPSAASFAAFARDSPRGADDAMRKRGANKKKATPERGLSSSHRRRRGAAQNLPSWKSTNACMISCLVFITNGP